MNLHEEIRERLRSIFGNRGQTKCKHETEDIRPSDENNMWDLKESRPVRDPYWSARDAAFVELQKYVKFYKCFGCGDEREVHSAERTGEILWKEEMTADEIAEMHEEATTGAFYNGELWWEHQVWDGDATEVATQQQWITDLGYTDWKEGDV